MGCGVLFDIMAWLPALAKGVNAHVLTCCLCCRRKLPAYACVLATFLLLAYLSFGRDARTSGVETLDVAPATYLRSSAGQRESKLVEEAKSLLQMDHAAKQLLKSQVQNGRPPVGDAVPASMAESMHGGVATGGQADFPPSHFDESPQLDMGASYGTGEEEEEGMEDADMGNDDNYNFAFGGDAPVVKQHPNTAEELLADLANSGHLDSAADMSKLPIGPAPPAGATFGGNGNQDAQLQHGNLRSGIQLGGLPVEVLPIAHQFGGRSGEHQQQPQQQQQQPQLPDVLPALDTEEDIDFISEGRDPASLGDYHEIADYDFDDDYAQRARAEGQLTVRDDVMELEREGTAEEKREYQELAEQLGFADHAADVADSQVEAADEQQFELADAERESLEDMRDRESELDMEMHGEEDEALPLRRMQRATNDA